MEMLSSFFSLFGGMIACALTKIWDWLFSRRRHEPEPEQPRRRKTDDEVVIDPYAKDPSGYKMSEAERQQLLREQREHNARIAATTPPPPTHEELFRRAALDLRPRGEGDKQAFDKLLADWRATPDMVRKAVPHGQWGHIAANMWYPTAEQQEADRKKYGHDGSGGGEYGYYQDDHDDHETYGG